MNVFLVKIKNLISNMKRGRTKFVLFCSLFELKIEKENWDISLLI